MQRNMQQHHRDVCWAQLLALHAHTVYLLAVLMPMQHRLTVHRFHSHVQWNAACSPAVAKVLQQSLERLVELGARQVNISLPELELAQAGHLVTIATEMAADAEHQGWLHDWSLRKQVGSGQHAVALPLGQVLFW